MVPGTANGVSDHDPFGERPVIMAAMAADGEHLAIPAHQQNLLIADVAD